MGVDTDAVYFSQLPTASFNVITDQDDNQVGGFYPGAMFDSESLSFVPWKDADALFVISPHDPKAMRRQVAECKTHGLRLFYDVGQQVSNIEGEDIHAGLEAAELLIANDYEISVICTKAKISYEALIKKVPVVVTTLGAKGSLIEGKAVSRKIVVGAAKPANVSDPTGAGDAYRAGFLYGYLRQMDLEICARLGSTLAVYTVEKKGTQTHKFTKAEFKERYKENFNEEIKL